MELAVSWKTGIKRGGQGASAGEGAGTGCSGMSCQEEGGISSYQTWGETSPLPSGGLEDKAPEDGQRRKESGLKVPALEAGARAKGVSLLGSQDGDVGGRKGRQRGVPCGKQPS